MAIAVAAVVLAVADIGATRLTRNSMPKQTIRALHAAPSTINVLGIGNSLMAAGFDTGEVRQALAAAGKDAVVHNAALGATGLIEHLMLTRTALNGHHVDTLVYGFFDHQMYDDVPAGNAEIFGNRNLLYLDPALTLQYAPFGLLDRVLFRIFSASTLLRERGTLWAMIERARRRAGSLGLPAKAENQFGRVDDFALLEAGDTATFDAAIQRPRGAGDVLAPPTRALLHDAAARGTRVVVVQMPMPPSHRQRFYFSPPWRAFRDRTKESVEAEGARYLDASQWENEADGFTDGLHLSVDGARRFSQRLAAALVATEFRQ